MLFSNRNWLISVKYIKLFPNIKFACIPIRIEFRIIKKAMDFSENSKDSVFSRLSESDSHGNVFLRRQQFISQTAPFLQENKKKVVQFFEFVSHVKKEVQANS